MIIIGLGNPGEKYKNTRHNIGSRIIDEFAKENNFPEFRLSKKFESLISENNFDDKKIILAKPQTFMNESGKAVKSLINFYKSTRTGLVVVHDDIDLPLGKIRISKSRGSAGHKGIDSIIKEIGHKNFSRLRIGIKPNQWTRGLVHGSTEKFVLEEFNKEEEKIVKKVVEKSVEIIEFLITQGLEKTMTKHNRESSQI